MLAISEGLADPLQFLFRDSPTFLPLQQNGDRYSVFVCSKGKQEYIQLLWLMLDPLGQLIPESGGQHSSNAAAYV